MMRHLVPALVAPAALVAQSVVVPNANATTLGTSQLNSIVRNAANPRSYQYGVNASELAGIPLGSVITGVSLRFMVFSGNSPTWPPADVTWTNYDIHVGPAVPTASWTGTAAANFAAPPQLVRSGPLTLDAAAFVNNGVAAVPNPWAEFYFDFQTPYLYLGGDLAMLFSHPGSTTTAIAQYPECVAVNAATHGVARVENAYPGGGASTATTFYVMRIHYGYGAGCPGGSGTAPVLVQNANTTNGAGGNIRLTIVNAPAGSLCVLALGVTQLSVPIGAGCDLLVSPDVLLALLADTKGRAVQDIPIPASVIGSFFAQGGVLDPLAANGLSVTNGVSPAAQ
jgi:hypothetical protein